MAVSVITVVMSMFVMVMISISLCAGMFYGADGIRKLTLLWVFDSEFGMVVVGVASAVSDGEGAHEGGVRGRAGAAGGPPVKVEVNRLLHEVHGEEAAAGEQGLQVEGKIGQCAILCNQVKEFMS